ncbi:MAG: hypothetical protein LBK56_03620 [Gracilibacteraceae bacterium]|jgi:hypothetical protein|nr:hypothetical protein [Gracilibacteraceae bacterium]
MRLQGFFAKSKYEARRNMAGGSLIIEESAFRDVVKRHWGQVKGVVLRSVRFSDREGGLWAEITLRADEELPQGMIIERSAAVKKNIEQYFVLPVADVRVRVEKTKRA